MNRVHRGVLVVAAVALASAVWMSAQSGTVSGTLVVNGKKVPVQHNSGLGDAGLGEDSDRR